MIINGIDLIAIAFGAFNLLRLASYFPQIAAVARDRNGASAISLCCWSIWVGANATTALYAWVNLGDLALASINAFNAACCAAVLLLAVYKRVAVRFEQAEPHRLYPPRPSPDHVSTTSGIGSIAATALVPGEGQRMSGAETLPS